jgi:hypothetical protein
MAAISRRLFLVSGGTLSAQMIVWPRSKSEAVYRFATDHYNVRMVIDFYDRYSSQGFWFDQNHPDRRYCLSADGQEGHNCLKRFSGSVAVARYQVRSRSKSNNIVLREHVKTIDQDSDLTSRPPFERVLQIEGEWASDIQAFGYEADPSNRSGPVSPPQNDPWCFLRQDLYLDKQNGPFLVVHWKHTLNAIRVLDVIPGERTRVIDQ